MQAPRRPPCAACNETRMPCKVRGRCRCRYTVDLHRRAFALSGGARPQFRGPTIMSTGTPGDDILGGTAGQMRSSAWPATTGCSAAPAMTALRRRRQRSPVRRRRQRPHRRRRRRQPRRDVMAGGAGADTFEFNGPEFKARSSTTAASAGATATASSISTSRKATGSASRPSTPTSRPSSTTPSHSSGTARRQGRARLRRDRRQHGPARQHRPRPGLEFEIQLDGLDLGLTASDSSSDPRAVAAMRRRLRPDRTPRRLTFRSGACIRVVQGRACAVHAQMPLDRPRARRYIPAAGALRLSVRTSDFQSEKTGLNSRRGCHLPPAPNDAKGGPWPLRLSVRTPEFSIWKDGFDSRRGCQPIAMPAEIPTRPACEA